MTPIRRAPRSPLRLTGLAVPALAALVAGSACGGLRSAAEPEAGPDDPITLDEAPPAGDTPLFNDSPSTRGGISNAVVRPFEINKKVWFAGFSFELARGEVDPTTKDLVIEGEAENTGLGQAYVSADVRLEQGGVGIADGRARTEASVLAGSRQAMTITFNRIPDTFDPAKAEIVIGAGRFRQVRVPLTGSGEAVTGEPVELPAPGPFRAGTIEVTWEKMWVRHDNPASHKQAPADRVYLAMKGAVRFDGLSTNFQTENLAVKPPNGPTQAALNLNALPDHGGTEDIYVLFEVPEPVGGDYVFTVKGRYGSKNLKQHPTLDASAEIKVTINLDAAIGGKTGGSGGGRSGDSAVTGS